MLLYAKEIETTRTSSFINMVSALNIQKPENENLLILQLIKN